MRRWQETIVTGIVNDMDRGKHEQKVQGLEGRYRAWKKCGLCLELDGFRRYQTTSRLNSHPWAFGVKR